MLRVEFIAEDMRIVAERDIKEHGVWTTNVSDTFSSKFKVVSLDDTKLAYLLLLLADGDGPARSTVPADIMQEFEEMFPDRELRPFP